MDNARPTPLLEDSDATREKLEGWLSKRRGRPVTIPQLTIPESTGMSNVTLLFDMEWEENGAPRSEAVVARLQPEIERPVFPGYDLSLQYEVMDAVGRASDIPVPQLRGLELDTSLLGVQFYLMKHTQGRIPTDMPPYNMDGWMMHETSVTQRETLWRTAVETMAAFHRLDYKTLGFEKLHEAGKTPLQQQLDYWEQYLHWALEGAGHTICEAAMGAGLRLQREGLQLLPRFCRDALRPHSLSDNACYWPGERGGGKLCRYTVAAKDGRIVLISRI